MQKKILAYTKHISDYCGPEEHLLQCSICGENDRNKLLVEDISIGCGTSGNDYTFCSKCWKSKNIGKKILELIDNPNGLKYKNEHLNIKEINQDE